MSVEASSTRTLPHPDSVVQEVLDIWTARILGGQIPLGDLTATVGRVTDWTDWAGQWMATAAVHEELAAAALSSGRVISGVSEYLVASRCYHLSYFLTAHDPDLHRRGLDKMIECHDRVLDLMEPAVEKVKVPFVDGDLAGLLSVPAGDGPFPVVVLLPGLDSTKETRHSGRGPLLRRGMAVFSLDGPGQGEVSQRMPLRHDYEVAVAAAIDYLESRPDIDADRVGLMGVSLGGYYACRSAAYEPRLKAVVANCGPYDWGEVFDQLPGVTRDAFREYSWSTSDSDAKRRAADLSLVGVAAEIRQPLIVVHGTLDPLVPLDHAHRIVAEAADARLIEVEGGVHCCFNFAYRFVNEVNDWMAERLGGTT